MVEFLVGVDGGGTATRALVARRDGRVLGQGQAGPSALGQGIPAAWTQVTLAISNAFASANLPLPGWDCCAVGAGLSGVSNRPWRDEFVARNIGFLYYRHHEGDDPHSLLRPPMHGNGDIDELKETL